MKVEKRDGRTVDFDKKKIESAVKKAMRAAEVTDFDEAAAIIADVTEAKLISMGKTRVTIEEIQDEVERRLTEFASAAPELFLVMRKYIIYRDRRDKDRYSENKLAKTFNDVINIEDNDVKRSNANINGNTIGGMMQIFGTEASKEHAMNYIINPKFVKAHKDGYIHIHDMDYYSTKATNCNMISLVKLFSEPCIYTTDSTMRNPKRISSFGALAAIALQCEQNEMFGGQAIGDFDYGMAKGVDLTFKEEFRKYYQIHCEWNCIDESLRQNFPDEYLRMGNEDLEMYYPWIYKKALEATRKETHEAMAAFIYNLCSMHSRNGAQIVFSSINYGTDDSPEGRMVIEETLNAIDEGLGDNSTAIFPISIFKVKDGINFSEADWKLARANWEDAENGRLKYQTRNFDLFIKACKVSAHRLFPNFVFEDTPFNFNEKWNKDDPERYKYELNTMGCRTRVYENVFGEKCGLNRGNNSFVTMNLVRLAIESAIKEPKDTAKRLEVFFTKLDYYTRLAHDTVLERYHWQCSAYSKQFPFIIKNKMLAGTEALSDPSEDKMEEVFKNGTLSIGFIGLAECLKELTGYHHGESDAAQELGLKIISRIRALTDKYKAEEHLNWSTFATPAEGLSFRFTYIDRARYGIIPGVTDRDFYTNSNHIPVYYHISALEKIKKEAPYHALTNAGHIAYVEMDGEAKKNVKAFAEIIVAMHDNNIGYGSINHAVDRCCNCSYEGVIEEACPKCGEQNRIDRIRRITGYLVGTLDRWNSGKLAEEKARVKHT